MACCNKLKDKFAEIIECARLPKACQDICVPDTYVPAKTVQNAKSVQDIWFPDKIVPKLSRLLPH